MEIKGAKIDFFGESDADRWDWLIAGIDEEIDNIANYWWGGVGNACSGFYPGFGEGADAEFTASVLDATGVDS